jgi:hypothetical protein
MHKWIIAAAAFIPAVSLATPITLSTFASSKGSGVTVKVNSKGGSIGSATAGDLTLGGVGASALVYSAGVNPQQGSNGNASAFAGDWSSFATFSGGASLASAHATLGGLDLTLGFSLTDMRHGTWSITNNDSANNLSLDLVFAMHTGGGSGSWLFDNYLLNAGSTAHGAWSLNLLNHGGQLADYSNLTLFARNAAASAVPVADRALPAAGGVSVDIPLADLLKELAERGLAQPGVAVELEGLFGAGPGAAPGDGAEVPEPGTLAVFLTSLAMLGGGAWRRQRRSARMAQPPLTTAL